MHFTGVVGTSVWVHVYAYGCVCASMILLDTLRRFY